MRTTIRSITVAIALLPLLHGCGRDKDLGDPKGGNGMDTFTPNVEAARSTTVEELNERSKAKPKSPDKQPKPAK